ncbi:MAG: DNA topoisomerase IB [Rhizobiaceae bacterium]|nr:DNA topoisomerase IB [Rhizobiaceae bacterium]MCV0406027.1 DNA topoisomerase IB [Rhizobiaceae bacterium]
MAESAELSARRASLVHVSDDMPGITRRRAGRGFAYRAPDGRPLRQGETMDRIRTLAIPPAWTDVWICPDPDGHIQATGRDARGRKQYRYHPRWAECRDEVKYSSLADFARALPALRRHVDADLRRRGLDFERVVASVVWLLDNTMIRVGNAGYARENGSFGLTTLRDRHVDIDGTTVRFAFKGKSGKEWRLKLVDRRIARIVKDVQDIPGQHLFQYFDEEGRRRPVRSQDVNDYIRDCSDVAFSSKHFRTWGGTLRALLLFGAMERPETKRGRALAANEVVDRVAAALGNTRAVCRRCYIHPAVFDQWEEGSLRARLSEARRGLRKVPDGLDEAEMLAMRWLDRL